jgi:hypothetical protein
LSHEYPPSPRFVTAIASGAHRAVTVSR